MQKFTKPLLILSIVFILAACGKGDGGFGIPSLSGYNVSNAPDSDFSRGGEDFPSKEIALVKFMELSEFLMDRYGILDDGISEIIDRKANSSNQTVKLNLVEYKNEFKNDGIINLSGSVTASWDKTDLGEKPSGSAYQKADFNISHDYDCDEDSSYGLGGVDINFKMKAKGSQKENETWSPSTAFNTREEAMAMSYVITFDSAEYSGITILNTGYAWSDKRTKNYPEPDWTWDSWLTDPKARVELKFYGKNGNHLFSHTFTEKEALGFLDLD